MKLLLLNRKTVKRDWFVVDVASDSPGRLATEIASRSQCGAQVRIHPHVDTARITSSSLMPSRSATGAKTTDKMYYSHSGLLAY
jgi:large subunit ribosomal protein L13